ncbi:MAG: DUF483 domain-containing protein [archaeon GB-1867-035]|nr:DUF483 domain-containing protein [Candidatus Culexmicrobium profundum]
MSSLLRNFVQESKVLNKVKVEDFLPVYFGIRPCSLITIPAELPSGSIFGKQIDEKCAKDLALILSTRDLRLRGELILRLRNKMRKLFKEIVFNSEEFKAHEWWAKKLNLRMKIEEVRPSIYEVYLYKDRKIGKILKKLFSVRREIRRAIYQMRPVNLPPSLIVYPEELSASYITQLGEVLGYPDCCIKRYADERSTGVYVEGRASQQIKELKKSGGKPNAFAYFSSSFLPCSPQCPKASEIGKKIYDAIANTIPGFEKVYLDCLNENVEIAEKYPDIIASRRRDMDSKVKRLISYM